MQHRINLNLSSCSLYSHGLLLRKSNPYSLISSSSSSRFHRRCYSFLILPSNSVIKLPQSPKGFYSYSNWSKGSSSSYFPPFTNATGRIHDSRKLITLSFAIFLSGLSFSSLSFNDLLSLVEKKEDGAEEEYESTIRNTIINKTTNIDDYNKHDNKLKNDSSIYRYKNKEEETEIDTYYNNVIINNNFNNRFFSDNKTVLQLLQFPFFFLKHSIQACFRGNNHRALLESATEYSQTVDEGKVNSTLNLKMKVKNELKAIVGSDRIFDDIQSTSSRGKPWSSYHKPTYYPQIVVLPHSTEEVIKILKVAKQNHFPIVPFGSGTSLEGHILSEQENTISIDFSQMTSILEINLEDEDVTVQPGIDYLYLNECLKPHGIFFPLDPGPGASIGGMCATRCSGSMAVKYGTMRDNVLKLKAVLMDGRVIETGTRARKSAAGYDLTRYVAFSYQIYSTQFSKEYSKRLL